MSDTDTDTEPVAAASGTVVGESIPTPLLVGMGAGLIFAIFMMICHISITKFLVAQRLKHIPRARKVKVKKDKKGKKGKGKKGKGKGKGKKDKKSDGTTGSDSSGTSATTGATGASTAASTIA